MNLLNKLTEKEINLLQTAGVKIEKNKDYAIEEKKQICMQVSEFIMSHSSKNGDISKLQNDYSTVLEKIEQ